MKSKEIIINYTKSGFKNNAFFYPLIALCLSAFFLPQTIAANENLCITTDVGFVDADAEGDPLKTFLNMPYGIAIDNETKNNNPAIYIVDKDNHRIRKIQGHQISTIAGVGIDGFDNELKATSSKLDYPSDVAVDSYGNIYIADSHNHCIRKINPDGIISIYAGIAEEYGYENSDGKLATEALLYRPTSIALDRFNNLYIADKYNHRIRVVYSSNQTIYTFAGNGENDCIADDGKNALNAHLKYPEGVYVDRNNEVWIADTGHHRILKVDSFKNEISRVAGDCDCQKGYNETDDHGKAKDAKLNSPTRVAIDSHGDLYIADKDNHRIRKVKNALPDGIITTYAGGDSKALSMPVGIAFDKEDNLFVTTQGDSLCHKIVYSPESLPTIETIAGKMENTPTAKLSTPLCWPSDIIFDIDGNSYIADTYDNKILKVTSNGLVFTIAGTGVEGKSGNGDSAIHVLPDKAGKYLYLSEPENHWIRRINLTEDDPGIYTFAGNGGTCFPDSTQPADKTCLNSPEGMHSDSDGNIYFADKGNHCVFKIVMDNEPNIERIAGNSHAGNDWSENYELQDALNIPLNEPVDVWIDSLDQIFIVDSGYQRVLMIDEEGKIQTVLKNLSKPKGLSGYKSKNDEKEFLLITDSDIGNSGKCQIFRMDLQLFQNQWPCDAESFAIAGSKCGFLESDGGLAHQAILNGPRGIAANNDGDIFFADMYNNRIRKLSSSVCDLKNSNQIMTVAGMLQISGSALQTAIREASGLATDQFGNVYYSDSQNHRVNRILFTGHVEAYAGNGTPGFSGDGYTATRAQLNNPQHLVFYDEELFIVDQGNHAIRKVDKERNITTLAGNGYPGKCECPSQDLKTSCFNEPSGIAMHADRTLYVSDSKNNRIVKIILGESDSIKLDFFAGTVPEPENCADSDCAMFSETIDPAGLSFDSDDNLYVADKKNNRIWIIDKNNETAIYAKNIKSPTDIIVDENKSVYIAASGQHQVIRIHKEDEDQTIHVFAGNGTSGCTIVNSELACLNTPIALALNEPLGLNSPARLVIADKCHRVIEIDTQYKTFNRIAGNQESTFSGDNGPALSASLNKPTGIATDQWGMLYIADTKNHRIRKVLPNGLIETVAGNGNQSYTGDHGLAINASLNSPHGIAADLYGNLFIADTMNHCIRVVWNVNQYSTEQPDGYSPGIIETFAGNGVPENGNDGDALLVSLNSPRGVAVDIAGNVYIADTGNNKIRKVDFKTREMITIANDFNSPYDVAVDQQRNIYVADTLNHTIKKISPNNTLSSLDLKPQISEPALYSPTYIDLDSASNLYISNIGHHRVQKVTLNSNHMVTIAGNGIPDFSDDNQNPIIASLNMPTGVAVASDNIIYVADSNNNYIRKLIFDTYPDWSVKLPYHEQISAINYERIIACVRLDGYLTGEHGDKLACFINGQCRGVASPVQTIKGTRFFITALLLNSESGLIHFKYYRNINQMIYTVSNAVWITKKNDIQGAIESPKELYVTSIKNLHQEIMLLKTEIISLDETIEAQNITIYSLETRKKSLENENDHLNNSIKSMSLQINQLTQTVNSQSLQITQLTQTVDALSYTLSALSMYTVTLPGGWHLMSSVNLEGVTATTEPPGCIKAIFKYENAGYVKITSTLPQTKGFWIKLSQKCKLIIAPADPEHLNLMR